MDGIRSDQCLPRLCDLVNGRKRIATGSIIWLLELFLDQSVMHLMKIAQDAFNLGMSV